ncbi:lantibiotic dehydratase, partial [Kitasatospora sp. LaBMicrA B282]|uniref:lantibiotic dehydratase n=1 Tax=Kitasatospora sp. LaBMicrA B282 TaxID=3420949 RepID=UPI003D0D8FAB
GQGEQRPAARPAAEPVATPVAEPAPAVGRRDRLLLALARWAAVHRQPELLLDDVLLARLAAGADRWYPGPPDSFDLVAQLRADSAQALQDGDFQLVVVGTEPTAGATAGRFGELLGAAHEQPRGLPAAGGSGALDLSDLCVVADPHRLALVPGHPRRPGHQVAPLPSGAPGSPLPPGGARLLHALVRGLDPEPPGWDWGPAEALPYLPRVRRGRTVLAPARWRPDDPALGDPATGPGDWQERFARWREHRQAPRYVQSADAALRFALDLDHPHHRELLREAWAGQANPVLLEAPPGGTGWLAPAGRTNELVFPLHRRAPGARPAPPLGA